MDDKKRKDLIKQFLAEPKNFDTNYSSANQEWFIDKIIRGLEHNGLDDKTIESKTQEILTKAKSVVTNNRDFTLKLSAAGNSRFVGRLLNKMQRHRVEILYGAIAFNSQFVESSNLNYLLFVAKRRFRSICRMYVWVNPNKQGYFRYPHRCRNDQHWHVNIDAKNNYWEELTPLWYPNYSPWKLKPAGVTDPVTAIESLFVKKTDACEGNLFDCETTTSIVFIDSFREAINEDQFMKKLASTGSEYILIHGFETDGHMTDFAADTSNNGLMVKIGLSAKDLQVGDQCYIINHPLYKTFRPTGSWTGEYSLVYATGDRNYRSEKGFVFGGHGKEGTLFNFYDAFITELISYLAVARRLMVAHLAYMRGGAAAILPGTVVEEEHNVSVKSAAAIPYKLMQYDKNVESKDFTKVPTKTKVKPKISTPAFVIIQSKTENIFYLEQVTNPDAEKSLNENLVKKISEIVASGTLSNPILFKRLTSPPAGSTPEMIYAQSDWGVAYEDSTTGTEEIWPFFELIDGNLQRKELKHDDLFKSPFTLFLPGSTDLQVRQPKVDFGTDAGNHQSFLTSNGAI